MLWRRASRLKTAPSSRAASTSARRARQTRNRKTRRRVFRRCLRQLRRERRIARVADLSARWVMRALLGVPVLVFALRWFVGSYVERISYPSDVLALRGAQIEYVEML